ncbi:MAG: universal stress protein [Acetobacteraceae bacterium]
MTAPLLILLPTDDSASALRAADHVVGLAARGLAVEVHLLNVQAPLRGAAASLIGRSTRADYHRDEGMKVLARTHRVLEEAGLAVHPHVAVGDAGETILAFARRLACQQIVMGTRGLGGVAGAILGSVANHVVAAGDLPVTLVKAG